MTPALTAVVNASCCCFSPLLCQSPFYHLKNKFPLEVKMSSPINERQVALRPEGQYYPYPANWDCGRVCCALFFAIILAGAFIGIRSAITANK
jgi:hypothetical protein